MSAGAVLRGRWVWPLALLGFGVLVLVPTWIVLPPDDENLSKEILTTVFQSREIFSGHYPFWDPFVAFGTPEPRSQALIFHPFLLFVELLPLGAAIGAVYQLQLWIGIFSVWGIARHFRIGRWVAALFPSGDSTMSLYSAGGPTIASCLPDLSNQPSCRPRLPSTGNTPRPSDSGN